MGCNITVDDDVFLHLHIKYHHLAGILFLSPSHDYNMAAELILKIKVIVGDKEKGWFLHKTRPRKTLKNVAVEILSGGNPCLPLEVVLDMIGIDINNGDIVRDAEFDGVLTSTAYVNHTSQSSSWCMTPLSICLKRNWMGKIRLLETNIYSNFNMYMHSCKRNQ